METKRAQGLSTCFSKVVIKFKILHFFWRISATALETTLKPIRFHSQTKEQDKVEECVHKLESESFSVKSWKTEQFKAE